MTPLSDDPIISPTFGSRWIGSLFLILKEPLSSYFQYTHRHYAMSATAPTVTDVHDLARQVAGNLQYFSEAYSYTAARAARTEAFLAAGTPAHMKRAILMDPSLTVQWLVVCEDQVVVLTRPVIATNVAGDPIFLASLGDSLGQATPVSIPDTVVANQVVALVTTDDSVALRLPGCAAIPGQLDPPPLPNADPADAQASLQRLHFDVSSGASGLIPVFGLLPVVYPLALGETPICQPLADPFPTTGHHSDGARVWFQAMRYLATHNAGGSLHSMPVLFVSADLPETLFANSSLTGAATTPIDTVAAMSPHFGHVVTLHRKTSQAAILAHASGLAVPQNAAPASAGDPGLTVALTTALAPLALAIGTAAPSSSHTTQSEREL